MNPIVTGTGHTETVINAQINSATIPPNMTDYDQIHTGWDWQTLAQELHLPRDTGVNQCTVCIDGHPPDVMQKEALIWVSKKFQEERYTFKQLSQHSSQFANALKDLGVEKGDRVFTYLERVPEAYTSIFGILKLGAIAGPLFAAFGPDAILDRLESSEAKVVITSSALKPRLDKVLDKLPKLEKVLIIDRNTPYTETLKEHEVLYSQVVATAATEFQTVHTDPNDYSIMHYTSGTTGKPKGAAHCHNAVVSQYATAKYVLDLQSDDIYWCTADPGWVTGTSYGMFGPWSNGCTQVVFEGGFSAESWYKILQDYNVTVWYTAPTAIRMLMKSGTELVKQYPMPALRHMCSVGEPLNPEAIVWGREAFGLTFHDTWWQTETGCQHIVNYPCLDVKPGSMGKPFPGTEAGILDEQWNILPVGEEGHLAIKATGDNVAPSLFKTYWGRDDLYQSKFQNGWYLTGDRAKQDSDGYFWFIGRDDDVINTAGHLVGPFEVESALVEHPAVAEAAVIGKPDEERLEIIKAFVSLKSGHEANDDLKDNIKLFVRNKLAAHAYPREIDILDSLPKTRSGKIMRRLLKARELGLPEGDTSTLEM